MGKCGNLDESGGFRCGWVNYGENTWKVMAFVLPGNLFLPTL